jgi:HPt (histidine-containing phosphotransfer) domain-containing protein
MTTLVDFARLDSFSDGDRALEAELCGLFMATAARYLEELGQALGRDDRWSAVAHSLKGAAGNFGAPAMAELAAMAEREAPAPGRLAELETTFAATRRTLEQHLA